MFNVVLQLSVSPTNTRTVGYSGTVTPSDGETRLQVFERLVLVTKRHHRIPLDCSVLVTSFYLERDELA